jgi:hypothetical protein
MEPLTQSREECIQNTHETFTALVSYLQINEPTPGSDEYAVGDCLVSALTAYERKTGNEVLRLFVYREILRHQLKQLKRRQTIPSRLTRQTH